MSVWRPLGTAWATGWRYLRRGLTLSARHPRLYLGLVVVYSLPSLAAAALLLYGPATPLVDALVFALPWITVAVAPPVVMMAVLATARGERPSLLEASRRGLRWVPRYLWTNVHTSAIFWLPMGALLLTRDQTPLGALLPQPLWLLAIVVVALHQHVRTLLAPYFAIHSDLNGTRATVVSWTLGGTHFWPLLGTFLLGTAPVAAPAGVLALLVLTVAPPRVREALLAASSPLLWVGIQAVRPILIPALHSHYEDLRADAGAGAARS